MAVDLLTAGAIAAKIGLPGAQVKKAIKDLGIKTKAKKGACSYYAASDAAKIKSAIKK